MNEHCDLVNSFNSVLDEMLSEANKVSDRVERFSQEKFKNDPGSMSDYRSACAKLDKWLEAHPGQWPDINQFLSK